MAIDLNKYELFLFTGLVCMTLNLLCMIVPGKSISCNFALFSLDRRVWVLDLFDCSFQFDDYRYDSFAISLDSFPS